MVFFTTPELLEIGDIPLTSPTEKPTRSEALKYYRKCAEHYDLELRLGHLVERVDGADGKFSVHTRDEHGNSAQFAGRKIAVATGYYDLPNRMGIPGEDLPHVSHYYTEPHAFWRRNVVVIGGKNSAAEAALDLYRSGAKVTLVHRHPELGSTIKYWVRPDIENRFKEGSIAAHFNSCVQEIRPASVVVRSSTSPARPDAVEGRGPHGVQELPADAVFLLVGYRADTDLFVRAGVELTDRHAPVFNPDTFETNVAGLFVAGGALAGVDTGTVFIENGRFHGEKILEIISSRR
jgi:thioredoxin reductase (NADPH)